MNIRKAVAVSCLVVVSAAPFATYADGASNAVNACVKSFVETYLPKDRVVRVRKLQAAPGPFTDRSSTYTVALEARGARSGEQLAQARCVANARGSVIVLDNPTVESYAGGADFIASVVR